MIALEMFLFAGRLSEAREALEQLQCPREYRAAKRMEIALREGLLEEVVALGREELAAQGAESAGSPFAQRVTELVSIAEKAMGAAPQAPAQPCPPPKKDWDRWAQEEEAREAREKDFEGDPAMHFFKQIYQNCDEDGKRAMLKSYAESNGRALSTNWAAEKDKDYKGKDRLSPPRGVQEQP